MIFFFLNKNGNNRNYNNNNSNPTMIIRTRKLMTSDKKERINKTLIYYLNLNQNMLERNLDYIWKSQSLLFPRFIVPVGTGVGDCTRGTLPKTRWLQTNQPGDHLARLGVAHMETSLQLWSPSVRKGEILLFFSRLLFFLLLLFFNVITTVVIFSIITIIICIINMSLLWFQTLWDGTPRTYELCSYLHK